MERYKGGDNATPAVSLVSAKIKRTYARAIKKRTRMPIGQCLMLGSATFVNGSSAIKA